MVSTAGVPVGPCGAAALAGLSLPIVLVVHEIWALHEHFKDVCRRLAKEGYLAVACDLFARQGDPGDLEIEHRIRAIIRWNAGMAGKRRIDWIR